jgi:hypothetical protein
MRALAVLAEPGLLGGFFDLPPVFESGLPPVFDPGLDFGLLFLPAVLADLGERVSCWDWDERLAEDVFCLAFFDDCAEEIVLGAA